MTKDLSYILFAIAVLIATVGSWLTHIVTCIQDKEWLLLIAGAIVAPVGMIHGWGIWLGFW